MFFADVMQLIHLHALTTSTRLPPLAMTIGNFDGVHLGHQALIGQVQTLAQRHQLATAVMMFEPQPLEFFLGEKAPPRITSLREKLVILRELGIDYVILAKFDDAFRQLTAQQFAELLQQRLNVQHLVLGDDFHFGKDRQGNRQFLVDYGLNVDDVATVQLAGERISSTRIRQVLADGDFVLAQQLLGRPYSIIGRVVYGDQIGRTLDFPTINVALKRIKPCLHGIYAVEVSDVYGNLQADVIQQHPHLHGVAGYTDGALFGAGHVGVRPAIEQQRPEWRLEVHFPKVSANLYGKLVKVTFLHYLHGERQYADLTQLKQGIDDDVQQLLAFRAKHLSNPIQG